MRGQIVAHRATVDRFVRGRRPVRSPRVLDVEPGPVRSWRQICCLRWPIRARLTLRYGLSGDEHVWPTCGRHAPNSWIGCVDQYSAEDQTAHMTTTAQSANNRVRPTRAAPTTTKARTVSLLSE